MKEIKSVGDNIIFEKKSGRYAVKNANKEYINGDEKTRILVDVGLVTISEPKAVEEAPVEEASEDAVQG